MISVAHCHFAKAFLAHMRALGRVGRREYARLIFVINRKERFIAGCDGKRGFATWGLAEEVRSRKGHGEHKSRAIYRCHVCHQFHLGAAETGAQHNRVRRKLRLREKGLYA